MKRSLLRMICACILMAIAVMAVVGIFAASKKEETVYVWQTVRIATHEEVKLYDADGKLIQKLVPKIDLAVSKLLPAGRYYAFSGEKCVVFALHEDRSVTVEGGCGWTDGKTLHLTDEPVGTIKVEFLAKEEFYTFELRWEGGTRRETVCTEVGKVVKCEFLGIPYGTYELFCAGESVSQVTLDAATPCITVAMTK